MSDEKICPVVVSQTVGPMPCMGEACAWWTPVGGGCAVTRIAKELRRMAKKQWQQD